MPRLNDLGEGKLEAPKLHPDDIIIREGWNYRDAESDIARRHINWLKLSIKETPGIQKPIEVEYTDGKVYVVDGECRVRAAKELLAEEGLLVRIPAIAAKGDEATIQAKSLVANGALPPTLLEFGKAAARLLAFGWSEDKVAQFVPPHIGLTMKLAKKYVKDAVELHEAPLAVKEAVEKGVDGVKVSPALAVAATRGNRLHAAEIIKEEAAKAKSAGKKVATRPKGAGAITKAKNEKDEATVKLLDLGDNMAAAILEGTPDWDRLERMARKWQKSRA